MKITTLEDTQEILDMSMKFISETEYSSFSDEDYIKIFIEDLLNTPQNEAVILLEPGVGFLAGRSLPFPFGPYRIATEIAWYVYPEHRGKKTGTDFLSAFEYWAREKAGCTALSMVCLSDDLHKYYNKRGYKLYERAYMKVLGDPETEAQ